MANKQCASSSNALVTRQAPSNSTIKWLYLTGGTQRARWAGDDVAGMGTATLRLISSELSSNSLWQFAARSSARAFPSEQMMRSNYEATEALSRIHRILVLMVRCLKGWPMKTSGIRFLIEIAATKVAI